LSLTASHGLLPLFPFHCPFLSSVRFFYCACDLLDLHSFPSRRSSDLAHFAELVPIVPILHHLLVRSQTIKGQHLVHVCVGKAERSEEHTSELQSRFDLVCRLLLEKKKKKLRRNT